MFRRGQRLLGRRNQGKVRRIFYYLRNRAPTQTIATSRINCQGRMHLDFSLTHCLQPRVNDTGRSAVSSRILYTYVL